MKGGGSSTPKLTFVAVLFMLMLFYRSAASKSIHQSVEESSSLSPLSSVTIPTDKAGILDPFYCEYELAHTLFSCLDDIISSVIHWSLKLGRDCCDAMSKAQFRCLKNTPPFTAYTVDHYKKYCYEEYGIKSVSTTAATATLQLDQQQQQHAAVHRGVDQVVLLSPSTAPAPASIVIQEIHQCFSTVKSIEGCLEGIVQSFLTGKVQIIRPACCKAIIEVNDKCWPNIFPLNPFFPPMLKDYCSNFVQVLTAAATGPIPEGLGL